MDTLTMFMLFFSTLLLMDSSCSGSSARNKPKFATSDMHTSLSNKEKEVKNFLPKEGGSPILADACEKEEKIGDLLEDALNSSEGQKDDSFGLVKEKSGIDYPRKSNPRPLCKKAISNPAKIKGQAKKMKKKQEEFVQYKKDQIEISRQLSTKGLV